MTNDFIGQDLVLTYESIIAVTAYRFGISDSEGYLYGGEGEETCRQDLEARYC